MKKKYATLKDVAEKSGVSISAVSKILSGKADFKEETKNKVFSVAKEIGYAPNALARSVQKNSGYQMIGFFIPNIMNPFFAELVNEVEKRLARHGFILTLCIFNDSQEKLKRFLKMLVETRATGCIIAGTREDECEEDFQAAKRFLSMVSIQADVENVDRVDVTDEAGTYEIVSYLISKGHKKIAFLGYRFDISILKNRLAGYYRALSEHHIEVQDNYVIEGKHDPKEIYERAHQLLSSPDRPTAIHCINELVASNVYLAAKDLGLRIPEDISVTGFDGISISKLLTPQLTTIQDPVDLLAQIAVDMLMEQIEHISDVKEVKQIYIQHRFLERESVKEIK